MEEERRGEKHNPSKFIINERMFRRGEENDKYLPLLDSTSTVIKSVATSNLPVIAGCDCASSMYIHHVYLTIIAATET